MKRLLPSLHQIRMAVSVLVTSVFVTGLPISPAVSQTAPADFAFTVESRPSHEYDVDDIMLVTMDSSGSVAIKSHEFAGSFRETMSMSFDARARDAIWQQVVAADFFNRDSTYENVRVEGGDLVTITIIANGDRHTVMLVNYPIDPIDDIVGRINQEIPPGHQIYYNALVYPGAYGSMEER